MCDGKECDKKLRGQFNIPKRNLPISERRPPLADVIRTLLADTLVSEVQSCDDEEYFRGKSATVGNATKKTLRPIQYSEASVTH